MYTEHARSFGTLPLLILSLGDLVWSGEMGTRAQSVELGGRLEILGDPKISGAVCEGLVG